jgi:NitT/TauT family transport system substrate-binding protein
MRRFVEDKALRVTVNASLALGIVAGFAMMSSARAEDTLRLAIGQRDLWNTCIWEVGQRGGIFKKHGVNLEILYTQGSGETQ